MKEILHTGNAKFVSIITKRTNPEWGTWIFIHDPSPDKNHTIQGDSGTRLLFENEFELWDIVTFKEGTPDTIEYNLAYDAHRGTSFSPERRAQSHMREFRVTLVTARQEIEQVQNIGDNIEAEYERFEKKARDLYTSWLSAKSRCLSAMITGPARFPTARNEKANRSERNHGDRYLYFLNNYLKGIEKRYRPAVTIEGELEQATKRLAKLEENHAFMKAANRILRSKKSDMEKCDDLIQAGCGEDLAINLVNKNEGFERFELTNNLAKIKNTKARVAQLTAKSIATDEVLEENDLFKCEKNAEKDRIMFFFDGKPADDVRAILKKNAFKWSPRNGAWQRKTTQNALNATHRIIKQLTEPAA